VEISQKTGKPTHEYLEYTVISGDTVNASAFKYYNVDVIAQLGAVSKWGMAIEVANGSGSPITAKVYSVPKNHPTAIASTGSQIETLFSAVNIAANYPLQKQISMVAPRISIEVTAGATQLTGVKITLWAIKEFY
jgi:hypothetical protein